MRKHPNAFNVLLLDAEQPLDGTGQRQQQLAEFPKEEIFGMVEPMEAWFLADRQALKKYYDDEHFQASSLPRHPEVEKIPKRDVIAGLKNATRNTRKGSYRKTRHAPKILEMIDPRKVAASAPQCTRLFEVLNTLVAEDKA